jgi:hypothetical protein
LFRYPKGFLPEAEAAVELVRLQSLQGLRKCLRNPKTDADECFKKHVQRVLMAFTREATKLVKQGGWTVNRWLDERERFLLWFTTGEYEEIGDRSISRQFGVVSPEHNGSLLPEIDHQLRSSRGWIQSEAELLKVLKALTTLAELTATTGEKPKEQAGKIRPITPAEWLREQMEGLEIKSPYRIQQLGGPAQPTTEGILNGERFRPSSWRKIIKALNRERATRRPPLEPIDVKAVSELLGIRIS